MDDEVPLPTPFRFYDGGDSYMLLADVCRYLNKPSAHVFSLYPSM